MVQSEASSSSSGMKESTPLKLPGSPEPASYSKLPRWRGFNLLEKCNQGTLPPVNKPYEEWDLDFMVTWGFNFIRLPTDYRIWTVSPGVYNEQPLIEIDQVISWSRQRGIHVNLSLHYAPGYCVNLNRYNQELWIDGPNGDSARQQFSDQWRMFAARYRGIPAAELSFNLVNEPPNIKGEQYLRAMSPAVAAIRHEDSNRLIIVDGIRYGTQPVPELVTLKVAQSTRGYQPPPILHYGASWVPQAAAWPVPTWPMTFENVLYNRETLWTNFVEPWVTFSMQQKIGIHVGEWGSFKKTPHDVVMAWMIDNLANWQQAGIGWALWNLRGGFGVLDSGRLDIKYEDYQGHKVDRAMLDLLVQG
jgi:endoglucanase